MVILTKKNIFINTFKLILIISDLRRLVATTPLLAAAVDGIAFFCQKWQAKRVANNYYKTTIKPLWNKKKKELGLDFPEGVLFDYGLLTLYIEKLERLYAQMPEASLPPAIHSASEYLNLIDTILADVPNNEVIEAKKWGIERAKQEIQNLYN